MTQNQEKNQSIKTDPERAVRMERQKVFLEANLNMVYMLKDVKEDTDMRRENERYK